MFRLLSSRPARPGSRLRVSRVEGQTLVEYALILAVISIVALAVFTALGNQVVHVFSSITSLLDTDQSS